MPLSIAVWPQPCCPRARTPVSPLQLTAAPHALTRQPRTPLLAPTLRVACHPRRLNTEYVSAEDLLSTLRGKGILMREGTGGAKIGRYAGAASPATPLWHAPCVRRRGGDSARVCVGLVAERCGATVWQNAGVRLPGPAFVHEKKAGACTGAATWAGTLHMFGVPARWGAFRSWRRCSATLCGTTHAGVSPSDVAAVVGVLRDVMERAKIEHERHCFSGVGMR